MLEHRELPGRRCRASPLRRRRAGGGSRPPRARSASTRDDARDHAGPADAAEVSVQVAVHRGAESYHPAATAPRAAARPAMTTLASGIILYRREGARRAPAAAAQPRTPGTGASPRAGATRADAHEVAHRAARGARGDGLRRACRCTRPSASSSAYLVRGAGSPTPSASSTSSPRRRRASRRSPRSTTRLLWADAAEVDEHLPYGQLRDLARAALARVLDARVILHAARRLPRLPACSR